MPTSSPLDRLAALFSASAALPDLSPSRLAPSTIFDLDYRVTVVAIAFREHASPDRFSARPRIQSRRLKLLQFTAMRPWLVPVIRAWSASRRDLERSLDYEEGLRRGFISDTMHDCVIDFLIAAGAVRREESFVIPGIKSAIIDDLYAEAQRQTLFQAEFQALDDLKGIVVTNEMLEGW